MTEMWARKKQRGRVPYSETKAQRIAADFQKAVKEGKYQRGDYLPNTIQLSKLYGIGSHTSIRIREILFDRKVIEKPIKGRNIRFL